MPWVESLLWDLGRKQSVAVRFVSEGAVGSCGAERAILQMSALFK